MCFFRVSITSNSLCFRLQLPWITLHCFSLYLPPSLPVCLSSLPASLPVSLLLSLTASQGACLSLCLSVSLSVCLRSLASLDCMKLLYTALVHLHMDMAQGLSKTPHPPAIFISVVLTVLPSFIRATVLEACSGSSDVEHLDSVSLLLYLFVFRTRVKIE